ncbi:hypothetical protein PR048_021000 [Dryococelus australis]|uniref:Transposase n=1 Tax=Dryococelus australis TaxID=614101 RepID=A0ABQ9GWZ8_9NEOP|nr:hypothetical protein PR048_021000 [Dryococelus australis]
MKIFLSFTELGSATADVLFDECGIELQDNLLGTAADGANVIMVANNSLSSRLKEMVHGLFIVKCICHSFHLCASKARQKLHSFVEQLTHNIYSYFSYSPKRISTLGEVQECVGTEPHKTRWLSFLPVVKRMLEQYQALILFFQDGSLSEGIPAAQYILTALRDPTYKLLSSVFKCLFCHTSKI